MINAARQPQGQRYALGMLKSAALYLHNQITKQHQYGGSMDAIRILESCFMLALWGKVERFTFMWVEKAPTIDADTSVTTGIGVHTFTDHGIEISSIGYRKEK